MIPIAYKHIIGVHEEEAGGEKVFDEIMIEKFPNLVKTINPQTQVAK